MGDELTRREGKYWVIFYQPLPEAGERIAVALVFEDPKSGATVEYDPTFAKLKRVYPDVDPEVLAFYLDSLRNELHSSNQVEVILNGYGPQLEPSSARRIHVPVSQGAIEMLMARYVSPLKKNRDSQKTNDKIAKEIEAFVRQNAAPELELRTNVTARDILGRSVTGTRRIALAIRNQSGWTLVDGVDLNQSTPQAAATRADEISRTFWNYHRSAGETGVRIRRVGVVLNGNSHLAPKTHEAHDYALHRFEMDSDLVVDGASTESRGLLRSLLNDADLR
jgi:hypothetical protein